MHAWWTKTWIAASLFATAVAQGETLYQRDGITLEGSVRMVTRGAGVCQVLAENHPPDVYEGMKGNHGQPLDVWRLDFAARNGSGRRLEYLTAHLKIDSEWPPCTNWTGPQGRYPKTPQWAGSFEVLQKPSGLEPGEQLSDTVFVLAFHSHQPRFENWKVDYRFGEGRAASPPVTASPEQENLFWQSIMNSTNPADFESYLEQFPNGVFRSLAQHRLKALEKTTQADSAGTAPAAAPSRPEPNCEGKAEGAACWMELASPPGCYVWDDYYVPGKPVSWSGACIGGRASGAGTQKWSPHGPIYESMGMYAKGKKQGHWMEQTASNWVAEGPYVDGKRHGWWVNRGSGGDVSEGPYVNGKRHGEWVDRLLREGVVYTYTWVNGEQHFVHRRKAVTPLVP